MINELRAIHRDRRAGTTLQLLLAEPQVTQTTLDHAIQERDELKEQSIQSQAEKTAAQAEVTVF